MTLSGALRGIAHNSTLIRPLNRPGRLPARSSAAGTAKVPLWVTLGGTKVGLLDAEPALELILARARAAAPPLAVASANLDHIGHFGEGSRWHGVLDDHQSGVEWLTLLDGSPLVKRAEVLTGRRWPCLAGSDIIEPILTAAEKRGFRIGLLGGTAEAHEIIRDRFGRERPGLTVAGSWAPSREELADVDQSGAMAAEIAAAGVEILLVCLGKPRQELWIKEYGNATGAGVLLAFGAVVDFLAGGRERAPGIVRDAGIEWAWRLALEPRRLARRYLVDGLAAYLALQRFSGQYHAEHAGTAKTGETRAAGAPRGSALQQPRRTGGFSSSTEHTDVAVVVVTYESSHVVRDLIAGLRLQTRDQSIKVIVADNSPSPATLESLAQETDVVAFSTGGNLGYAGGINAAIKRAGTAESFLILNPDLSVEPDSIRMLRQRMSEAAAGVVVPLLVDDDGSTYPSIRREPSVLRAFGDAAFGSRLAGRPDWLSEIDYDTDSYLHPHKVSWATGAALLIRRDVVEALGDWDERYFLYSEETDYFLRVRQNGWDVWFEPGSRMHHRRGGSGASAELNALLAVNRIRYARKHHSKSYASAFRFAVVLGALLRSPKVSNRGTLRAACWEASWAALPRAHRYVSGLASLAGSGFPPGAVIIPAHNEAAVIGRTLSLLAEPLSHDALEVIVACNSCSDDTALIAAAVPGVQVIEVPVASKPAALNAGDAAATKWPRIYLDADVELTPAALRQTLEHLSAHNDPMCVRPACVYDTGGATLSVQAYYRARTRLHGNRTAMWGAGVYAMNKAGHDRLGTFPEHLTGDDLLIDRQYAGHEKHVLDCPPVVVRTPRSPRALLATLGRIYRGNAAQEGRIGSTTLATLLELIGSVRGPGSALDAAVYAGFSLAGRWLSFGSSGWGRDETSRKDTRLAASKRT